MLLPGLEREAVRGLALRVLRQADQASGHPALENVRAGEEGGVGATVRHRDSEPRAVSERDVGSPLSRRGEHGEREEVGRDGDEAAELVSAVGDSLPVSDLAAHVGVLEQDADEVLVLGRVAALGEELLDVSDDDLDTERLGTGLDDGERLGEDTAVDVEGVLRAAKLAVRENHRLRGGGSLVEEGRVGDVEASERGRERLEVDERLETACGDIRQLQVAPIAERPAASP